MTPTEDEPIGQFLRRLRDSQGLSKSEVARRIEAFPSTVHNAEKGGNKVAYETVRRIAAALGYEIAITPSPPSPPSPRP